MKTSTICAILILILATTSAILMIIAGVQGAIPPIKTKCNVIFFGKYAFLHSSLCSNGQEKQIIYTNATNINCYAYRQPFTNTYNCYARNTVLSGMIALACIGCIFLIVIFWAIWMHYYDKMKFRKSNIFPV